MSPPAQIEDLLEVTPFQAQMLAFRNRNPSSLSWRTASIATISGPLDTDRLRAAFEHVVSSHSILRTSFHSNKLSKPIQAVHQRAELDWKVVDDPIKERAPEATQAWLQQQRSLPFDFNRPPLMRVVVRRFSETSHELAWTNDHILLDGWSRSILLDELAEAYEKGVGESRREITPFGSYIRWLQKQDQAAGLESWRAQLSPIKDSLSVLPARARDAPTDGHATVTKALSIEVLRGLQQGSARRRVTLNTVMQAAWVKALSEVFKRNEFAMGVVVAGRPPTLPGVESLVGMLVNVASIPIRVPTSISDDWLSDLDRRQVELREHDYVSPQQIATALGLSEGQFFPDNVIRVQNFPRSRPSFLSGIEGLQVGSACWADEWPYPLDLLVAPSFQPPHEGLRVQLSYAPACVSESQANALLEHVAAALLPLSRG